MSDLNIHMDVFDIFTLYNTYIYLTYVLIFQFCRATPVLLAATALVYRTDEIIQVTFLNKKKKKKRIQLVFYSGFGTLTLHIN